MFEGFLKGICLIRGGDAHILQEGSAPLPNRIFLNQSKVAGPTAFQETWRSVGRPASGQLTHPCFLVWRPRLRPASADRPSADRVPGTDKDTDRSTDKDTVRKTELYTHNQKE